MGILTDEPLIDDTELDDFDWDQHVTSGGNMLATYHRVMHAAYLVLSAGAFKLGTALLDGAIKHQRKFSTAQNRNFGGHAPVTDGVSWIDEYWPDEDEYLEFQFALNAHLTGARVTWIDAEPMSDFDTIHPDYVDHYSQK